MTELETITNTVKELLNRMGFEASINIDSTNQESLLVNIETDQARFLIGQAGVNLEALQHLTKLLISRKNTEPVRFVLDINNYRKNRIELLEKMALNIAKEALSERVSLVLQPMSAYERRVIHLALSTNEEISTESVGEGEERRIVIKPK